MSTADRDNACLHDMMLAARQVSHYMDGVDRDRFDGDRMLQDAVVRQLTVFGEAAGGVSEERRALITDIPWHRVVGLRNRIVHDYRHVRLDIVWDVASNHIPELLVRLERLAPLQSPESKDAGSQ